MLLKSSQKDYLLTSEQVGINVMIHHFNDPVVGVLEGDPAVPGYLNSYAVSSVNCDFKSALANSKFRFTFQQVTKRLRPPDGKPCGTPEAIEDYFYAPLAYTQDVVNHKLDLYFSQKIYFQACERVCYQKLAHKNCGCWDPKYLHPNESKDPCCDLSKSKSLEIMD